MRKASIVKSDSQSASLQGEKSIDSQTSTGIGTESTDSELVFLQQDAAEALKELEELERLEAKAE